MKTGNNACLIRGIEAILRWHACRPPARVKKMEMRPATFARLVRRFGVSKRTPMMRTQFSLALLLSLLTACANPVFDVGRTETVLPLSRAWIDGRVVEYITTDVSDAAMAQMTGANFVPRLADAIPSSTRPSLVERVYKFAKNEQISIFQSAPKPAGATNADRDYSPLWRVVMVHWRKPDRVRELRSEEELLSGQEKGDLTLEVTGIVVNCPVTRAAGGQPLRGVR